MNASTSSTAKFSLHPRLILLAVLLCLACGSVLAQSSNLDYTNDMPSVERVKAEIKGSDPTDTLARQVAVFTYLQAYVQRIKYNRSYSGPFTPGEQRVIAAYSLAAYQMSQDYAKTHTPAEAAAFERLHGQYEMNSDFYKDWSKRLIGPQSAGAYKGAEAGLAATRQAHVDSIKRANEEAQAQAQAHSTNAQGLSNDPTAVATRRCLELGGSSAGCMGKGFMSGFMNLIGGDKIQESLSGPGAAGVVLSGLYKGPASPVSLGFGGQATLAGCGKLVADPHNYTIDKQSSSVRVTVANEPAPILLTMRPDGGFTGPGLITVTGHIISGYHTVTTTQMINGYRASPDQCNGPCQTVSTVPDYAPATARCTIGSLSKPPDPKPAPTSAQPADNSGMMGVLTGLTEMMAPGNSDPGTSEVGLRMTGKYSDGTLLLDFTGNSLVLDCGEAHVRAPYTVENAPNAFLIHVQNSGGPFTLAVQPDSSLRGAGSTTINGKLVTGMKGEDITFAPHSETCNVGAFRPKTGATPTASVAVASPVPAASSPVSPATAPSGAAATSGAVPVVSTASSGMTLAISSSFPIANNPLAGRVVQLMSERYDIALRKVGAPIAADVTPGRALVAYMANCGPPKSCPAYATAMHPYFVGKATFDGNGKATVTADVPPGSYYVFSAANGTSGALVWDLPITLKAGDNTVTLTATNAEIIH
jgi:hypothetical protein